MLQKRRGAKPNGGTRESGSSWRSRRRNLGAALAVSTLLAICLPYAARAQSQARQPTLNLSGVQAIGSITVSVKSDQGTPLTVPPVVAIRAATPNGPMMGVQSQKEGEDWVFTNLVAGAQYIIRVEALGFQTAEQFVNLPNVDVASASVRFFLVPSERAKRS